MKVLARSLAFAMALMLLSSATAEAAILGWWRLGDDDGSLAVDEANIGNSSTERTVNSSGILPGMYFQSNHPLYSIAVPENAGNPEIYDPYTDTTLSNNWSMYTPGGAGNQRLRTGNIDVPNAFTFETFVQIESSVDSFVFVNHQSSSANGWRLQRQIDGAVTAILLEGSDPVSTITSAASVLPVNEWHHVAVVYQNSSEDGVDDFFLYVDYNLVAQGNGTVTPQNDPQLHIGNAVSASPRNIRMDEARYFDEALTPDAFLRVVPEPTSLSLASIGVIGLAVYRLRRKNRMV